MLTEKPLKSVSYANRSVYLRPACLAAARNACFSFFKVAAEVPSTAGALDSSTSQARGLSLPDASMVWACAAAPRTRLARTSGNNRFVIMCGAPDVGSDKRPYGWVPRRPGAPSTLRSPTRRVRGGKSGRVPAGIVQDSRGRRHCATGVKEKALRIAPQGPFKGSPAGTAYLSRPLL